jgi:hypothetical protein
VVFLAYQICKFLTLVAAPPLVFSATPRADERWLIGRLLAAAFVTYILLNASLHIPRMIRWHEYETCQHQFDDGYVQHHPECGEINIADGASNVFFAYLGWIPAVAYVGLWELVWRIWYCRSFERKAHVKRSAYWFSCLFVLSAGVCFYIVWMFIIQPMLNVILR